MSRFFSRKDKMSPNLNSNAEKTRDPEQPIVPVPLVPNAPQPVTHGPIVMKPVVQSPTTPTPTPIIYHTIPSPYYSREASQRSTYITPLSPTLNASSPPRILSSTQTTFINIDHNAIQKMSLSNDHRPPLYTSANLSYNSSLASNASTNSNGSTSSFSIPHSSDFSPTRSNFPVSRTSQHRSFASYNLDDPIDVQQFHRKNNPSNTSSPLVPKGRPIKPYSSIGSCLAPAGFASRAVRTSSRTPDKPSTSHLVMAIFPVEDYDTDDTMRILFNSNIGSMQGNQTVERTSYWQVDSLSDMVTLVQFPEPSLEECHQTLSYMDKLLGYCLGLTSIILMVPTETVISEIEELFELIDHLSTTMETIDPSSSWWSRILIIFDDKETDETMVAEHRAGILRIQLPCIQEKYRLEKAPAFMFINSNASSFLDETDSARYQLECQRIFRYLVQSHHQDGWWRVSSYNESVEQDYSSSEEDIEIVKLIEPKKREPLPRTKIILNH